jgi:hypothetical protein
VGLVAKVPGPVANTATPGTQKESWELGTANGVPDKSVGRTTAKAKAKANGHG